MMTDLMVVSSIIYNYVYYSHSSHLAVCSDGTYHKYSFSPKGECQRETFEKFLQMTDD